MKWHYTVAVYAANNHTRGRLILCCNLRTIQWQNMITNRQIADFYTKYQATGSLSTLKQLQEDLFEKFGVKVSNNRINRALFNRDPNLLAYLPRALRSRDTRRVLVSVGNSNKGGLQMLATRSTQHRHQGATTAGAPTDYDSETDWGQIRHMVILSSSICLVPLYSAFTPSEGSRRNF